MPPTPPPPAAHLFASSSDDLPPRPNPMRPVAYPASRLHTASMPNVLVRNVPDEVHATLIRRAERRGQSLQQYLSDELASLAARPSVDELFERIERRQSGRVGLAQAAADIAEERERR